MFSKKIIALAISAAFVASCSKKNEVTLANKNFESEIELKQNLVFTFDKELAPDSLIDRWDSTQYIAITPQVKGLFKWNNKKELLFSPDKGFEPSTDYIASLTKNIVKHQKVYSVKEEKYSFHTPYLNLTETRGYWSKSSLGNDAVALMLNLGFNYNINPSQLATLLTVKIDGKQTPFKITSAQVNDEAVISIEGFTKNNIQKVTADINIAAGLTCVESKYKTTAPIKNTVDIPLPDKLTVNQTLGEFIGTQTVMHVYTNQPVDETDLNSLITIAPKISFATETTPDGFLIKASFDPGVSYQLTITKKLRGLLGGEMTNDYQSLIPFGQMQPSLSFSSQKGMYLSSRGSKNLGVNVVNIPKVYVTVYKIYENNILGFLTQNRNSYYDYDEESYSQRYNIYNMENFSDVVYERMVTTKDLPKNRGMQMLNLSLDEINNFKGVYLISVRSVDDYWQRITKLVAISDVGLIAKQTENEIYVFANSIKTTNPVSGAQVSFISSNNQVLFSGKTDGDGIAVFSNIKSKYPGFRVEMITAKSDGDFTCMVFNDSRVETSRYDVGGRYDTEGGYTCFMYGDRNIYRPGETIYMNSIVRTANMMPAADMPVKIKLYLPNGKEFKTLRGNLNKQGALSSSFQLPAGVVTGNYTAEIYTANDVQLASRSISVEEFMPDRIDVKLKLDKEEYKSGDTVATNITALNMFGPPAANRNYEVEFSMSRQYFSAPKFSNYNFQVDLQTNELQFENKLNQGKTDKEGNGTERFELSESYKDVGLLQGKIYATVFDETGRPVNRTRSFNVYTQNTFYGIQLNDYYNNRGERMQIPLIAVDKKGNAVAAEAIVEIINHQWYSVIEGSPGSYRYVSQKREITMLNQRVKISPQGYTQVFIPNNSGEYEVRVSAPDAEHYVSSTFYAYGYGYTQNTSFQVNTEGQVTIETDKEKYEPGEQARLLFKTPFAGKLLVTVESNKLLEHFVVSTDKKSAMLNLKVKENYLPNVYISATLIKPLDDGSIPLTVAHGYQPLMVEKKENKLPVTISCVDKSRSRTKQTIKIKTLAKRDIEVTVAVVDEGILALKNYKTPDPYEYFYQKRALQVNSYDMYPNILPELSLKRSSMAGDGYDLSKRVNPLTNKRVQLVALWSGILKTNSNGEASYIINIPQFSGSLRVMACAYYNNSFGSAEKNMKVADPVVISPSIPRFLAPGDTLLMPVTLTNTTAKDNAAKAIVSATGNVKVLGATEENISLTANNESRTTFKLVADKAVGTGSITVNVNAFSEVFTEKTEITVRPITSLLKESDAGSIKGGEVKAIDYASSFVPSTLESKLILSRSPMVQFTDQLSYLLDYPHGCLEQTVSIAFPQIYYIDLVKMIKNKPGFAVDPSFNIQEAIRKIETMQMYNGGLSYWPGSSYENWWGSAYALHFLTEAQKAGYDVSKETVDKLFSYHSQKAKERAMEPYWFYDNGTGTYNKQFAKREIFYSLYLLALNDKKDLSTMNYYKANLSQLTLDSRYMLACAYLALGDDKSYNAILPNSIEAMRSVRSTGSCFYSAIRDEALALNCLLETNPDHPQVGTMVKHLSQQIKKDPYMNTNERAWAFIALGKFMKRAAASTVTASILADGKTIAEFKGDDLVLRTKDVANKKIEIKTSGSGNLYFFTEQSGLRFDNKFKEEDSYLQVRKSFYDRFGNSISGTFTQGDLIVVKITLFNKQGTDVDNVVITDMLPAGFEIENPRLTEDRDMPWIKDQFNPDYFDVRDDRINLYTTSGRMPRNFYYLVRAVSTGNFIMGPVSADAMYNTEYHSYNGAGVVKIVERE